MAWRAPITSAILTTDANYEMFLDTSSNPIIIFPKPREVIHFVFSIAGEVGTTDTADWEVLGGNRIITDSATGTITSDTIIDLAAGDNQANDFYLGMYFNMTSGGEIADLRAIDNYVSSTDAATLIRALSGTPTLGETYSIYHLSQTVDGSGSITAVSPLVDNTPGNDEFGASGYPVLIPRGRASAGNDAHPMLLTYTIDGVDA